MWHCWCLLLLTLILPGVQLKADPGCPRNWKGFDDICVVFMRRTRMNWKDAGRKCKQIGGRMYEPRLWNQESEIRAWVISQMVYASTDRTKNVRQMKIEGPWIGLNDNRREGDWRYSSDRKKPKFTKWAEREPNNYKYKRGRKEPENCAVIWYPRHVTGYWNDRRCSMPSSVLCEKPRSENWRDLLDKNKGQDRLDKNKGQETTTVAPACGLDECMKKVFNV